MKILRIPRRCIDKTFLHGFVLGLMEQGFCRAGRTKHLYSIQQIITYATGRCQVWARTQRLVYTYFLKELCNNGSSSASMVNDLNWWQP